MAEKVCTIVGMGSGVSAGVARRFGREGFQLALLARNHETLRDHAAPFGDRAKTFPADAADPTSLRAGLAAADAALGPPDVLVYNVAVLHEALPTAIDVDAFVADFRANVAGALVAVQSVVPAMKARGTGTILLTGGGLALDPWPPMASLAVGKAGVRSLAFSCAKELEPHGIHVATVTICGVVGSAEPFMPDSIAEAFWTLHAQPAGAWERELVYR